MIMALFFIFIGVALGIIIAVGVFWFVRKKPEESPVWMEKEKIDITIQDIIRLAALNTTLDVTSLIIEYKINIKFPEFYERYQALNKRERELYFDELITIFSKNRPEYVRELYDQHPVLSTQDVLLLLMNEMKLDNKTIARVLALSMETLKKRKTRLKAKIRAELEAVKTGADA